MKTQRDNFRVDTPFVKSAIDDKGTLELMGYASTWVEDRDGEYVDPHAFDESLEQYLSKNPIVLWQHNMDWPIGTVKAMEVDHSGLSASAHIPPPETGEPDWAHLAYNKIKRGIVKTFSIGGFFEREMRKEKNIIAKVNLLELSVVSVPSNPDSIFEAAAKAITGTRKPDLNPKHVAQMSQILGLKAITDPELATMSPDELDERYEELAAAYRAAALVPPDRDAWEKVNNQTDGDVIGLSREVIAVARKVYGHMPDTKRGRVISSKNENLLRKAQENIDTVLKQLDAQEEITDPAEAIAGRLSVTMSGTANAGTSTYTWKTLGGNDG